MVVAARVCSPRFGSEKCCDFAVRSGSRGIQKFARERTNAMLSGSITTRASDVLRSNDTHDFRGPIANSLIPLYESPTTRAELIRSHRGLWRVEVAALNSVEIALRPSGLLCSFSYRSFLLCSSTADWRFSIRPWRALEEAISVRWAARLPDVRLESVAGGGETEGDGTGASFEGSL